ncbi:hypothetical protein [Streptomyces sp. S186]|uniref:hypothetical protein n=1 Tax=Streptomyces sp. S186 TaxID=3434395 RepID=UPI003F667935
MHTIPLRMPLDDTGLPHRQEPSAPAPAAPVNASRYNHPHFLGTSPGEREGWIVYTFAPFTGTEPTPTFPTTAYDDTSLTWELRDSLHDQYTAARIAWSHARLRRQAKALLHKAASLWTAWTTARDELIAVFEEFWSTSDGHWRAQLLRLTDAERAVNKAAGDWDTVAAKLAKVAADQIDVAGYDEKLPLTTVAQELGYDASDWMIHPVDDYAHPLPQYRIVRNGVDYYGRATPLTASATQLVEAQRERLREVANLAGAADPADRALD